MEGTKYLELKASGALSLKKQAQGVIITQKLFDTFTGKEKLSDVKIVLREGILARKAAIEADLAGMVQMLSDFDAEDAKEVTA